jgi:alkylated DNA repair dioxygenase AlkB
VRSDLFAAPKQFNPVPLIDGEAYYLEHLPLGRPDHDILRELIATVFWRSETIVMWGKAYKQPRLTAWYGEEGRVYKYSSIELDPLPWTEGLLEIKARVEDASKHQFNSVLLNYYRDDRDSVGMHSDDEPELGERPIIASLSLGEERTFVMIHKRKKAEPLRLRLASGSILLMKGETQRNWRHGIPKETRHCGPRVNLTFRYIHPLAR